MSPEERFAGINPERLAMLQEREDPAPRDFSGRGRGRGRDRGGRGGGGDGGGRGGGRGGYQANRRRFIFNEGVVSPAAANGGTKESTPAEEQLSGAEMRLAFKRNRERRSDAVAESGANGVGGEERKRKRNDEDTAAVGSLPPKPSKKRKSGEANGVAVVTNGTPAVDKKQKHRKKEKKNKRAEKAKECGMEMKEEAAASPIGGTRSSSEQLPVYDDPSLSREARKAAKKARKERKERKEKKEKKKAAKAQDPLNGDVESREDTSRSKLKPKKDKKSKKDRSGEPSSSYTHSTPVKKPKRSKKEISARAEGAQAELKWAAAAADLPGDDQRKSKFLRLLGAGAGASAAAIPTANGSASSSSSKTREKELERQYDAGRKMKTEKKRRGLGA